MTAVAPDFMLEVARAALCEAGRPDLAEGVYVIGLDGAPNHRKVIAELNTEDRDLLLRAFLLAHQAAGQETRTYEIDGIPFIGWTREGTS